MKEHHATPLLENATHNKEQKKYMDITKQIIIVKSKFPVFIPLITKTTFL